MPRSSLTVRPTHRKVHVSLPSDVYDEVRRRSRAAGAPFSTTLSAIVRRELERQEQAQLEEALRLDREANAAIATGVSPVVSRVLRQADADQASRRRP